MALFRIAWNVEPGSETLGLCDSENVRLRDEELDSLCCRSDFSRPCHLKAEIGSVKAEGGT